MASLTYMIFIMVIEGLLLSRLVHCQHFQAVPQNGNWTVIPAPEGRSMEAITISTNYLWGIDSRDLLRPEDIVGVDNVVYCPRPCSDASSWIDVRGRLDRTIDVNEDNIWGVNVHSQIYIRPTDGSGNWLQISGMSGPDCRPVCFSDVSVSNSGYAWAISKQNQTYILCQRGITYRCANNDKRLIDAELSLVHIEAGDKEVWAVDANNHIFKRPVDGSGEWSSVPGEMRYISASGNAHIIWGIAPNDSLYVCVKPCSGDWQYVGGSFNQIDGGNNMVIGVTTDNTLIIAAITSVINERITNEISTITDIWSSPPPSGSASNNNTNTHGMITVTQTHVPRVNNNIVITAGTVGFLVALAVVISLIIVFVLLYLKYTRRIIIGARQTHNQTEILIQNTTGTAEELSMTENSIYRPSDQSHYYEIDEIEGAADRDSLVYNDEYLSLIQ